MQYIVNPLTIEKGVVPIKIERLHTVRAGLCLYEVQCAINGKPFKDHASKSLITSVAVDQP